MFPSKGCWPSSLISWRTIPPEAMEAGSRRGGRGARFQGLAEGAEALALLTVLKLWTNGEMAVKGLLPPPKGGRPRPRKLQRVYDSPAPDYDLRREDGEWVAYDSGGQRWEGPSPGCDHLRLEGGEWVAYDGQGQRWKNITRGQKHPKRRADDGRNDGWSGNLSRQSAGFCALLARVRRGVSAIPRINPKSTPVRLTPLILVNGSADHSMIRLEDRPSKDRLQLLAGLPAHSD
jgi:hypothetical protein